MTMRPTPPSVTTNISAAPVPPGRLTTEHLYLVGTGNEMATKPSDYSHGLEELLAQVPADSAMANGIANILAYHDRINISLFTLPANPTTAMYTTALRRLVELTPRPGVWYTPGATGTGVQVGTLANNLAEGATTLTLGAAHSGFSDGEVFQIENELVIANGNQDPGTDIAVHRGQEGTTAAAHASGRTVTDLRNPIVSVMEQLAETYRGKGVADAPNVDVDHAIAWADAGNVRQNVMGVYNYVNNTEPGGHWLGATIDHHAAHGNQRGIEFAPVSGVTSLARNIVEGSPELTRLVGAYLSVIARDDDGHPIIVGDTLKGVDSQLKTWSNARIADHILRTAKVAGRAFIGRISSAANMLALAFHVQQALASFVNRGEIRYANVTPHPTLNTAAERANGRAHLQANVGMHDPIKGVIINVTIPITVAV